MFVLGDFVFAKVHGYRPWPARVLGRYGTVSKIKYKVFFYGTCNTAKVSSSHIFDFVKNKRRLGSVQTEKKNTDFRRAMAHMWKAFTKPETDSKYYQVLARMKDESETCLAYEMLTPTTESDTDSEDSQTLTKTPKKRKSMDMEQDSEESSSGSEDSPSGSEDSPSDSEDSSSESTTGTDRSLEEDTSETESGSEEETTETESSSKEEQAPAPLKKPKTSMSLQYDHDDKAHVPNVLENQKGNPIVKDQDNADPVSRTLKKQLKNLEDDKDSKSEPNKDGDGPKNDQPINLSCRYIPGGEQLEKSISLVGNAHLQDLEEQDYADLVSRTVKEKLKNLEEDKDSKLKGNKNGATENEQPINLCCRHIPGDEQKAELA